MRIFLSYASENRTQAEEIALALRGAGHEVFFDRSALPGGEEHHSVIRRHMDQDDRLVFLISK